MTNLLAAIIAMAGVTYLIRVIPFILIKKNIDSPFLQNFFFYMPYSVLSAMTFPAIFYSTGNTTASIVATLVSIILGYFRCNLFTITIIAVVTAYIVLVIL